MKGLAASIAVFAILSGGPVQAGAQEKASGEKEVQAPKKEPAKKTAVEGGGQGAQDAEPNFKSSKGKESFKKAMDLFDIEKYSEALTELKKAKDQGKTPDDKARVDLWMRACEGGTGIGKFKKMSERGALANAFFIALDTAERYRDTPIYPKYVEFTDGLRKDVCEVLDDFEIESQRFKKEYGKEFVRDPSIAYRGERCLLWSTAKGADASQLELRNSPRKWLGVYHSVVFWMKVVQPVEVMLVAKSPGTQKKNEETSMMVATYSPPARPGWVRGEVILDQFKKHGGGTFANVEKFFFRVDSKASFKLYIDDVCLVKNEAVGKAGEGDSDAQEEKDSKKSGKKAKTTTGKIKQTEVKKNT